MQESESSRTHTEVKCNGFAVRHAAGAEAVRGCRRRRSCVTVSKWRARNCAVREMEKEDKKQTCWRTGTNKERKAARAEFFLLALTALRLTG